MNKPIINILRLLSNPSSKIVRLPQLIESGADEDDVNAMIEDGFLKPEYYIPEPTGESTYLNQSDIHHYIVSRNLYHPEKGELYTGEICFHYKIIKRPS